MEAYGFDLSPMAMRHAEFFRLAVEGKAERRTMRRHMALGTAGGAGDARPDGSAP